MAWTRDIDLFIFNGRIDFNEEHGVASPFFFDGRRHHRDCDFVTFFFFSSEILSSNTARHVPLLAGADR